MKIFNKVTVLLLFLVVISACNETNNGKTEKNEVIAQGAIADMKKLSLDIDGMTCEIGCARTIQSKLSKTEGVKLAQVNFSDKKGIVEYDANIITEKEIIATVEKIADGDLYKVTNTSEVE
jgi:Cu+-exporting ATPase